MGEGEGGGDVSSFNTFVLVIYNALTFIVGHRIILTDKTF